MLSGRQSRHHWTQVRSDVRTARPGRSGAPCPHGGGARAAALVCWAGWVSCKHGAGPGLTTWIIICTRAQHQVIRRQKLPYLFYFLAFSCESERKWLNKILHMCRNNSGLGPVCVLTHFSVAHVPVWWPGVRDTWWQPRVPDVTHPSVTLCSPALITHQTRTIKDTTLSTDTQHS